jgi:hypothetical protein
VPLKVYDETITVMKSAVARAKLGTGERLDAIRRLDEQSRQAERYATGPSPKELVAREFDQSHLVGGRSVFGDEPPPAAGRRVA